MSNEVKHVCSSGISAVEVLKFVKICCLIVSISMRRTYSLICSLCSKAYQRSAGLFLLDQIMHQVCVSLLVYLSFRFLCPLHTCNTDVTQLSSWVAFMLQLWIGTVLETFSIRRCIHCAFGVLTLLVRRQEEHSACKTFYLKTSCFYNGGRCKV